LIEPIYRPTDVKICPLEIQVALNLPAAIRIKVKLIRWDRRIKIIGLVMPTFGKAFVDELARSGVLERLKPWGELYDQYLRGAIN
jgi:hypothetical protein